jgi:predicted  nucleic acid-binding Zn-ribbon protein
VKKRVAAIENEVSRLTKRVAVIEEMLAEPELYKNGPRVIETQREYRALKQSIASLTGEWDNLTVEAEKLTQEFQRAMDNIEVQSRATPE